MALLYCKDPYLYSFYLLFFVFCYSHRNARDKKEKVWTSQAEHFFKQGKFDLAATYFGKTQRAFEEVTLRFISLTETGGRDALKTYLFYLRFSPFPYSWKKFDREKVSATKT